MASKQNLSSYGGQVSKHYEFWTTFCKDRHVLKHVTGITIPFTKNFKQTILPRDIKMNETEKEFVRQKLKNLITTGCIVPIKKRLNGWVSNIFLRPKKDGSFRLILNLKPLNQFIEYKKFKMPSIKTVTQMIKRHDHLISVDLLDAYNHAKIRREDCLKLQFQFEGKLYMYRCCLTALR